MKIKTQYGVISGVLAEYYEDGKTLRTMIANDSSRLHTEYGSFLLNYTAGDVRKKFRSSVEFFRNGALRSVYLEEPEEVATSLGPLRAELVTFYEAGGIKRVFPLYGQLSGYWTEENEYELAEEVTLTVFGDVYRCKPLCIYFYPSGSLHSVTIWHQTEVTISTDYGRITTRHGFELYEDGRLKSIEPCFGTVLHTKYGDIYPFDCECNVFHADNNSLKFSPEGELEEAATIQTVIKVYAGDVLVREIAPEKVPDIFDDEVQVIKPMRIRFSDYGISVYRNSNEEDLVFHEERYQIRFETY